MIIKVTEDIKVQSLNEENFLREIGKGVALIDFYATWCAPCRMLTPIVEEIAEFFTGRVIVGKVDIESDQKIAAQYEVTSVPTLILFKDGKEVNRLIGLRDFNMVKIFVEAELNG